MHPILPDRTHAWQALEQTFRELLQRRGYAEIRLAFLEHTELFKRSIGEVTDIVEKEMYTFKTSGGTSVTLRPEGTAGCVRAAIDQGLLYNQQQRLWYLGPMFRHEKPQAGRYRQFYQLGVEAFGFPGVDIELEHLLLVSRLWSQLGLSGIRLEINTLGSAEERARYREVLVDYLRRHESELDEDSRRRLDTNPMRVLDSKNEAMQPLLAQAPKLMEHLGEESAERFARLLQLLDSMGIEYTVNPRLVRGLDYYCHTVYEWVTDELGAQSAVCAGGRFDGLIEQLGGRPGSATGFAIGIDRLILLMDKQQRLAQRKDPDVYMVLLGEAAEETGFALAETLRDRLPGLHLVVNCGGGSMKAQMKRADKSGAGLALLIGADEVEAGEVSIKYLREEGKQIKIEQAELAGLLSDWLEKQAGQHVG